VRRLALLLALLALAGCGGDGDGDDGGSDTTTDAAATTESGCETEELPATEAREREAPTEPLDSGTTYVVRFETNCGEFTVRLDPAQSPETTASIVSLVESGYFDDTVFHRISPGFVIQGGDPTATGTGGPGYQTVDTPPPDASYELGTVAMAKTAADPPGTSGSQFFIVTADNAGLPPEYAIIGTIDEGMDTVTRIAALATPTEQPAEVALIRSASVETS
jgi:cyclophilin family peptidyl-prolyl cis-trans isomerase